MGRPVSYASMRSKSARQLSSSSLTGMARRITNTNTHADGRGSAAAAKWITITGLSRRAATTFELDRAVLVTLYYYSDLLNGICTMYVYIYVYICYIYYIYKLLPHTDRRWCIWSSRTTHTVGATEYVHIAYMCAESNYYITKIYFNSNLNSIR